MATGGDDCSVALWETRASSDAPELRQAQRLVHHDDIVSPCAGLGALACGQRAVLHKQARVLSMGAALGLSCWERLA